MKYAQPFLSEDGSQWPAVLDSKPALGRSLDQTGSLATSVASYGRGSLQGNDSPGNSNADLDKKALAGANASLNAAAGLASRSGPVPPQGIALGGTGSSATQPVVASSTSTTVGGKKRKTNQYQNVLSGEYRAFFRAQARSRSPEKQQTSKGAKHQKSLAASSTAAGAKDGNNPELSNKSGGISKEDSTQHPDFIALKQW